jgi:hypothetical protein
MASDSHLLQDYGQPPQHPYRQLRDDPPKSTTGSAIFNALIAFLGTAITIVTVVFAVLTWKVAVQAENTAIVQAQIGLLQYCAPNVPTTLPQGDLIK